MLRSNSGGFAIERVATLWVFLCASKFEVVIRVVVPHRSGGKMYLFKNTVQRFQTWPRPRSLRVTGWLSIALAFTMPATTVGGTLPVPFWSTATTLSSDDGYADLRWAVQGQDPVSFFRLTERYQGESAIHFVDHPTTRLYRRQPGHYEFWVQACTRDSTGYPTCGLKSPRLDLTVDETVDDPPAGKGEDRDPPVGQIRSPSTLAPGRWHNPDREGHGWSLFWKNRLSLPENHPLFGDTWDLFGLWYTYELRGGIYRPVYAELSFTSISTQFAQGTVWITRSGSKVNVGDVTVTFHSEQQATIHWNASFLNQHLSGEDAIEMLVAPDSDPIDNHSHYSGLWEAPAPYAYMASQGLGWTSESIEVVFEDEDGQPSWVMAEADDPVPGHTDLCFYFISDGVAPGTTGNILFYENGCDADVPASATNRNGYRRFTGFEEEQLWVNFQLPGGSAPDQFVAGTAGFPHELAKAATFHRVSYQSAHGPDCELDPQTLQCDLNLTWFSDGNYSHASVFVHESQSGDKHTPGDCRIDGDLPLVDQSDGHLSLRTQNGKYAELIIDGCERRFRGVRNRPGWGESRSSAPACACT